MAWRMLAEMTMERSTFWVLCWLAEPPVLVWWRLELSDDGISLVVAVVVL
jgi:hypothetical protein